MPATLDGNRAGVSTRIPTGAEHGRPDHPRANDDSMTPADTMDLDCPTYRRFCVYGPLPNLHVG